MTTKSDQAQLEEDNEQIIGEAIREDLSVWAVDNLQAGISPLAIVRALITVAGKIGGRHTVHMCGRTTSHI